MLLLFHLDRLCRRLYTPAEKGEDVPQLLVRETCLSDHLIYERINESSGAVGGSEKAFPDAWVLLSPTSMGFFPRLVVPFLQLGIFPTFRPRHLG